MKVKELIKLLLEFPSDCEVCIDIDDMPAINIRSITNIYQAIPPSSSTSIVVMDGDWGNKLPDIQIVKHFKG